MRSSGVERVPASSLRPSDRLVTPVGRPIVLVGVRVDGGRVHLTSFRECDTGRTFTVLGSTMFVRVKEDRRIVMRPDLSKGSGS